ncbi:MAG TPA: hypothetical protein VHO25_22060 [Polyangiaceae bacterium]|nr:hypothetical protein [Polyangiaceae bacterium]
MTKDEHRQRLIIKVGEQRTETSRLQMVVDELAAALARIDELELMRERLAFAADASRKDTSK